MTRILEGIGQQVVGWFANSWRVMEFSFEAGAASVSFFGRQGFRAVLRVVLQQVYFTGLQALPFLGLLSLLLGFTVIIQSLPQLQGVGANALIGKILVIFLVMQNSAVDATADNRRESLTTTARHCISMF